MNKLLLTTDEAAEVLGVGTSKVHELCRSGAIESVRIGRCRRIPSAALDVYVEWLRENASGYEVVYRVPVV